MEWEKGERGGKGEMGGGGYARWPGLVLEEKRQNWTLEDRGNKQAPDPPGLGTLINS